MKLAILCLSLATTALAAPPFFHYLPHYAGSRQQAPSSQGRSPFTAGQPLPQLGIPGAYSMEFIYPHSFAGTAGSNPAQSSHGFLKVSIPQPPGRQSVEVYYPYDFSQQKIMTNAHPMGNIPQFQNAFPFEYPPQNIPQQIPNIPPFDVNPLPSQDPLRPLQQDQPTPTSKTVTNI